MTNRSMSEIVRKQKPLTMRPEATLGEACREMDARRFGAVLVTDEAGHLLGIFTGRDAVRCLGHHDNAASLRLTDVMTRNPHTMPPGSTAIEALRLMQDGGFRHMPVVAEGVVVGIVSRGDFRGLELDRLDDETGIWERI
ncbi:MAG TPA: CBS domain-containing protein [Acetobacteraceae bacterium]|nr:CBS domain-containing protein [Acetobacteraceae bacterium]